jgi:hypothetical protein
VADWLGEEAVWGGKTTPRARPYRRCRQRPHANLGFMMGWTEADSDALFRQPPDEQAGEDASSGVDGSHEAMRRLRFPFEADPADAAEQRQHMPLDADEYRR